MMQKYLAMIQRDRRTYIYAALGLLISMGGVLFRAGEYLRNRSFWMDESALALNILNRSFAELWKPLDFYQGAPVGFLMAVKAAAKLFGTSELSLRLFPFIAGILSIFLFWLLASWLLNRKETLVGLFLFSFAPMLIIYSTEFKQYSSDVFFSLLILLTAVHYFRNPAKIYTLILFAGAGAAAMWFSHSATFVLAAAGLTLFLFALAEKRKASVSRLLLAGIFFAVNFGILYFVSLKELGKNEVLLNFWQNFFAPFPPKSLTDLRWYADSFLKLFDQPLQNASKGIAAFCFLIGLIGFFEDRRLITYTAAGSIFCLYVVSMMEKYPFEGRFLLFLVPILIIVIVRGAGDLGKMAGEKQLAVSAILVLFLAVSPTMDAVDMFAKGKRHDQNREVIAYTRQNWQDGDVAYVYYGAATPFYYYARMFQIPEGQYTIGKTTQDWGVIQSDLEQLRGRRRVWFVYGHPFGNDVNISLYFLRQMGREVQAYSAMGAGAHLFDLSQ